ncbi:RNA methyltransferase [soil metagenome]
MVEGVRAIVDAIRLDASPEFILVSESFEDWNGIAALDDQFLIQMDARLIRELAGTESPQGLLAVFPMPSPDPGPATPALSIIADGVSDPGNLGTLLRTAAGVGASACYLTAGSVDPFNPKVVRAAMGAHFRLPIREVTQSRWPIDNSTTLVVCLDPGSNVKYYDIDMTGPVAIIVGSEAHGVSESSRNRANVQVSVPLEQDTESLNAAVAASIVLFEARRQRDISSNRPESAHNH